MKILVDHHLPFLLAHGGVQILIERTQNALSDAGMEVEPMRWWDDTQTGDLIHFFGRVPTDYLRFAHQKGLPVVMSDFLSAPGARSALLRASHTAMVWIFRRTLTDSFRLKLAWDSYKEAEATIFSTPLEAQLAKRIFRAPSNRVHVVTNGVEDIFLKTSPVPRGPWLLCTARIAKVKRVLEVARAAVRAGTPLWVVGRPVGPEDPYTKSFLQLVKANPQLIRHDSFLSLEQLALAYRQARGFVLLSRWESLSLAALEASAGECPLLLSDLAWARSAFGSQASYCPVTSVEAKTAAVLRWFYDKAPQLKPAALPITWREVAVQLKALYEEILKTASNA